VIPKLKVGDRVLASFQPEEHRLDPKYFEAVGWRGEFEVIKQIEASERLLLRADVMAPGDNRLFADVRDLVDIEIVR
jgi:hypothetical protein